METIHPLPPLTPGQAQELAIGIVHHWQAWKTQRAEREATWQACWDAYLCKTPPSLPSPWEDDPTARSQVHRPVLYEAVETLHANLMNALFSEGARFFTVVGQTEADQTHTRLIEDYLHDKLDAMGFEDKFSQFLKQAIVTGSSVAAIPWRVTRQHQSRHEPLQVLGVTVGARPKETTETVYEGPDLDVMDLADFILDPQARDLEHALVIRQLKRTVPELQAQGIYQQLDHLAQRQKTSGGGSGLQPEPVTLLEAWGDFQLDDTLYTNYVATTTADGVLIRFEPSPFNRKPFIFCNFISVPNELYGIGAIEKSLGLQHAINSLTNQKLDVINISINNPFTYLISDDVFNPETLVTKPGALIPVKSHDTLRPLQYLNNFTVAFNEIADLKAEVQEASGAFKYFSGGGNQTGAQPMGRTATEVSALVQGGGQKYSSILAHLEQSALEPFLTLAFSHCQQFLQEATQAVLSRHADGSLCHEQLSLTALQTTRCRFRIRGARASYMKGQELENLARFMEILRLAPPQVLAQVNFLELYKRVYRRLGFKDEQTIFTPTQSL